MPRPRCRLSPASLAAFRAARLCSAALTFARRRTCRTSVRPAPAERPDEHQDREELVPRGRDQLLTEGVGGRRRRTRDVRERGVGRLADTQIAPGVNETVFASELPPITLITVWNVTGIPYAARKQR